MCQYISIILEHLGSGFDLAFTYDVMIYFLLDFLSFNLDSEKQRKVSEYYKKQERLLAGFNEVEAMNEMDCLPGSLTEVVCSSLVFSPQCFDYICLLYYVVGDSNYLDPFFTESKI